MIPTKPSKAARIASLQSLIAGAKKHFSGALVIAGKTYTVEQIVGALQVVVDLSQATSVAKGGWLTAVAAEQDGWSGVSILASGVRQSAKTMFSASPNVLLDFGILPRKRAVTPTAVKAEAVVKRTATRAARGTKSKKAKAKIKGAVVSAPKT